MADKAPNIILILADSLRADALGCYGNPHGVTPHIDELADRGLRYETCYSTSPLCVPARSQLLSGRLCHETGNMQNQAWRFHTDRPTEVDGVCLDPGVTTLPERLHDLGYNSAHLGKNHFYPRDCSYGFQEMEQCDFYGRDVYEKDDYYLHLKEKGSAHLHRDAFGRMDVVGTGGATLRPLVQLRETSEVFYSDGWGALKLTLYDDRYAWEFIAADKTEFRDSGTASCVPRPHVAAGQP